MNAWNTVLINLDTNLFYIYFALVYSYFEEVKELS